MPAAVRAMRAAVVEGRSMPAMPVYGTSECVGLSPTTPHHEAGARIEPPWSQPTARSMPSYQRAAAEPLDEPPAERSGSNGLRVGPYQLDSPPPENARSSMFVMHTISAPARRMRSVTVASYRRHEALEDGRAAGERDAGDRDRVLHREALAREDALAALARARGSGARSR